MTKKIDVEIKTNIRIPKKNIEKLFPKMQSLYKESVVLGREIGAPIRLKPSGKLSLKRGLIFTNEDIGSKGSVDISGETLDVIGDFHTHIDPPIADLSAGDVCNQILDKRWNSIECVAGADGVWCYRLRPTKKHGLPKETLKLKTLCKKPGDVADRYLYTNYFKILQFVAGKKQWIGNAPFMLKRSKR